MLSYGFANLFREYGLPDAIRTDNGNPFASSALCGLSRLNVWRLKPGYSTSGSPPVSPSRTAGTSACTAP